MRSLKVSLFLYLFLLTSGYAEDLNYLFDTPVGCSMQQKWHSTSSEVSEYGTAQLDFNLVMKQTLDDRLCEIHVTRFRCDLFTCDNSHIVYDSNCPDDRLSDQFGSIKVLLDTPLRFILAPGFRFSYDSNIEILKEKDEKTHWSVRMEDLERILEIMLFAPKEASIGAVYYRTAFPRLLILLSNISTPDCHWQFCMPYFYELYHHHPRIDNITSTDIHATWSEQMSLQYADSKGHNFTTATCSCNGFSSWNKKNSLIQNQLWKWEQDFVADFDVLHHAHISIEEAIQTYSINP